MIKSELAMIRENLDVIVLGTNSKTLDEAIRICDGNSDYRRIIQDDFNVPYEVIKALHTNGSLTEEHYLASLNS